MSARDTIAKALNEAFCTTEFKPIVYADRAISALTAAGHTIVGPADMAKAVEAACTEHWTGWGEWSEFRKDKEREVMRAALTAAAPHMPVPAGWVLVPVAALKWLNGEGPDGNGHGFGDAPDDNGRGAFWWRKKFTDMLDAAPKPAALTQEPKPAEGEK